MAAFWTTVVRKKDQHRLLKQHLPFKKKFFQIFPRSPPKTRKEMWLSRCRMSRQQSFSDDSPPLSSVDATSIFSSSSTSNFSPSLTIWRRNHHLEAESPHSVSDYLKPINFWGIFGGLKHGKRLLQSSSAWVDVTKSALSSPGMKLKRDFFKSSMRGANSTFNLERKISLCLCGLNERLRKKNFLFFSQTNSFFSFFLTSSSPSPSTPPIKVFCWQWLVRSLSLSLARSLCGHLTLFHQTSDIGSRVATPTTIGGWLDTLYNSYIGG